MTLCNEDWYQIVKRLESTSKHGLKGHPIIKAVSNLARRGNISDLPILNLFIDDIVACLPYEKQKGGTRLHPSVSSEFLADLIKPWAEAIRAQFFESEDPPFTTIEEVMNYYEEFIIGLKLDEDNTGDHLGVHSLLENEQIRDYNKLLSRGITIPSMWLPEEKQKQIPKSLLLRERAEMISNATGLNSTSVMFHILMGSPPLLPQLEWQVHEVINRIPVNVMVENRYATITFRNEVTFNELYSAYRQIRSELGTKNMKAFNEKHLELYLITRKMSQDGNQPIKGIVAFWKAVQEEWNTKHPKAKEFFERDVENLSKYFKKQGVDTNFEKMKEDIKANKK